MYKIRLICEGVPSLVGEAAARCITEEFAVRHWHKSAICLWDGFVLTLEIENDFDENGLASQDEFSDTITACISEGFAGGLRVARIISEL